MPDQRDYDAVIVGAGFAGLYQLHTLRELGLSAKVFEAGNDVGGTWFWNRYPGARCDVESLEYQYSFSDELQREWNWTERYATQPEILKYAQYVAEKFDLRPDIQFETRVTTCEFNESTNRWSVETDQGDAVTGQFLIAATGCLSAFNLPNIPGIESFQGKTYHTGQWPHEGVDFSGQRVAMIGTGSSAIQSIPQIAKQAKDLTVFQRTPNYAVPAQNHNLPEEKIRKYKDEFAELRRQAEMSGFGINLEVNEESALEVAEAKRREAYERCWEEGGFGFLTAYADLLTDKEANDTAAEFVRDKIRSIVKDADTAELLAPKDYPFATKRLCVEIDYFEAYNRDNVHLVSVRNNPVAEITPTGLTLQDGQAFAFDAIVFATGFDAMTGALLRMDIRGRANQPLAKAWEYGPVSYLGLNVVGFPNLFTITGPGSPSVLSNMMVAIEQHVEWIANCLQYLREHGIATIEAGQDAQDNWVAHVAEAGDATLFPLANSWYVGANIPGKPRVFAPYIGGMGVYTERCDEIVANGYEGFKLTPEAVPAK